MAGRQGGGDCLMARPGGSKVGGDGGVGIYLYVGSESISKIFFHRIYRDIKLSLDTDRNL